MKNFQKLHEQYGTEQKKPLYLPSLIAPCDQCERDTGTKILFMRQGLGNACAICGRLRRGKPYLSKAEFKTLRPESESAQGGSHAQTKVV